MPSGEVTESENISCPVYVQDSYGLSSSSVFLCRAVHSPSAAKEKRDLLPFPAQVMGKGAAQQGTGCSSRLPASRAELTTSKRAPPSIAGLSRRILSLSLPQNTSSKPINGGLKHRLQSCCSPALKIRYLRSHQSPLNEPARVWPLFYWVKTFSHGQMIRKLDAMGDKGHKTPITVVKRHFSHISSLSSSRKLIKLVSNVVFIQNATISLWIE